MKEYIWLFPVLFMFHDMEEIIGTRSWLEKHASTLQQHYPRIYKMTKDFSTEGFALAMFEEFILCILICLATSWSNHPAVWGLWLGVFIACAIHFVVHILQAILLKTYIPALLTSLICLPPSIWIGTKVLQHFSSQLAAMAPTILLGGILTVANLLFAQRLIGVATRWLNHY